MSTSNNKMVCSPSTKYQYSSQCIPGRFLGSGSFGQVFSAKIFNPQSGIHKQIAVKRALLRESSTLQKEAKVLSAFSDCHDIIDFYTDEITFEEAGTFYNLFMEYAPAGDLEDLIEPNHGLPDSHVRAYTRTILKALQCLHDKSYVHCDVKPENILAFPSNTESGYRLKLADFGLAKEVEERSQCGTHGTAMYMCPEARNEGERIGPAWDIWSLGCTVVVMATGESVWLGRAKLERTMCEEGNDFLNKCFDANPKKRWPANMLLNHPYISPPPPPPRFLLPHHIFAAKNNRNNCNGSNNGSSVVPVPDCVWQ